MKSIKFSDIKEEVQDNLQKNLLINPILGEDGFTLIDGFISPTLKRELTDYLKISGDNIPAIGIVGNTTGRIYTFALTHIMPNISI